MTGFKKRVKREVKPKEALSLLLYGEESSAPSDEYTQAVRELDRRFRLFFTSFFGPVDLQAYCMVLFDNMIHTIFSPGTLLHRQLEFGSLFFKSLSILSSSWNLYDQHNGDPRFDDESWNCWPFYIYRNLYKEGEKYLFNLGHGLRGVEPHAKELSEFTTKQLTDMLSPANFPHLNPVVIKKTIDRGGLNLLRGGVRLIENVLNNSGFLSIRHSRDEYFKLGISVAASRGQVVMKNRLAELIQFHPTTNKVSKIPILLVPAWINKFYILDLQPWNSMVKYLLDNGFSVFIISWKNVDSSHRDVDIIDYMHHGPIESIKTIKEITGAPSVNLAGYCLGGTLSAIAASYLGGRYDNSISSLTMFAGQLDFSDAGDLRSFIDESQVSFLEDLMEDHGYLDEKDMSRTFSLLNSRNLYWNYFISEFYLDEEPFNLDFLFWNDDATRVPQTAHVQLLRSFYQRDDLTEGKFMIEGKSLDLRDIDMDLYSVATQRDHIAPWKSVYRNPHFISSPIKFVLASSGHIAGIVNPPISEKGYYFTDGILGHGPDYWLKTATRVEGSWWDDWKGWLKERSAENVPAYPCPVSTNGTVPAPGTYVFEK